MKTKPKRRRTDPEKTFKGAIARIKLLESQVRVLLLESGRKML
jgi:hypothetical protein